MRIGINASFARKANTGIGQVTINFLKKLSENKNHDFFVYLEEDIDISFPKNFRKKVFLPLWKRDDLIRKIWWEKYLLPKKIKEDKCEIFISLYQSATILPYSLDHIMVVHDIVPEIFPEYLDNSRKAKYYSLVKEAMSSVDKIISISSRTEKDLIQRLNIPPENISISNIDVDPIYKESVSDKESARVMKKYNISPGYIYGGGGLEVRKNIEGLLMAYSVLLRANKKEKVIENFPKLIISGKLMPSLAPLVTDAEKLLKKLNLTQNVKLLDFVPQKDLPALYKNCIFFVYPSFYEGFGLPVLEAMSQGKPVVTSKRSSLPEVGGDSVLYCDPEDKHDIAMVMRNVMMNRNLRETLSRRARKRADNFSWDNFVNKILNIIENI